MAIYEKYIATGEEQSCSTEIEEERQIRAFVDMKGEEHEDCPTTHKTIQREIQKDLDYETAEKRKARAVNPTYK